MGYLSQMPQTALKHVLVHCQTWAVARTRMLAEGGNATYESMLTTTKRLKAVTKMMMDTGLLKQFELAKRLRNADGPPPLRERS